jgi:hypothetical protein
MRVKGVTERVCPKTIFAILRYRAQSLEIRIASSVLRQVAPGRRRKWSSHTWERCVVGTPFSPRRR